MADPDARALLEIAIDAVVKHDIKTDNFIFVAQHEGDRSEDASEDVSEEADLHDEDRR